MNLGPGIDKIIEGLYDLKGEISSLEDRIRFLEHRVGKDDDFFTSLEQLLQARKMT